ncbi:MAG: hypothetical protein F4137_06465 [Acidobacteria bacterium]|nr:hypothetical protein [Acidobacteriota bacterium]
MDLVVLVPDLDLSGTVRCLLNRPESIGIRPVSFLVNRHLRRDAGCRTGAVERLREFIRDHRYALVMFDKDGSGDPRDSRESIRDEVELRLSRNGWEDRCKAIVIEPELEAWIWNGSRHVPEVLGWQGDHASLRDWLAALDLWSSDAPKPSDPKRALKAVLRKTRTPLSARLYRRLADTVSVRRCTDPAFSEFRATLQRWFPRSGRD